MELYIVFFIGYMSNSSREILDNKKIIDEITYGIFVGDISYTSMKIPTD